MGAILYAKILGFKKQLIGNIAMLALPLVFILLFGGISGSSTTLLPFVNEDQSHISDRLAQELEDTGLYRLEEISREELAGKIKENEVPYGIIIPEGFEENLNENKNTQITIMRSTEGAEYFAMQGVLQGAIQNVSLQNEIIKQQMDILGDYDVEGEEVEGRLSTLVTENFRGKDPISIQSEVYRKEGSAELTQVTQASLGFLLFFSMFPIIFIIGDILEDKRYGIWDRILISPISKLRLYGTNLLFTFTLGMIQVGLLVFLINLLFDVNWLNNITGIMLVLTGFVFAVTALGLFISNMVKNHQQLNSVVPVIVVSTSMLGGAFWPIELISSKVLLTLARITPQYWAMEGLKKLVVLQQGVDQILLPIAILLFMGVLLLGLGISFKEAK